MTECDDTTCVFNRHAFARNICAVAPELDKSHKCMTYQKKKPSSNCEKTIGEKP